MWRTIKLTFQVQKLRSEPSKEDSELSKELLPNGSVNQTKGCSVKQAKGSVKQKKIFKSRSVGKGSAGDKLAQEDGSDKKGKVADQSFSDSNLQQKNKYGELKPGHPTFGPYYAGMESTMEKLKERSYDHVLESYGCGALTATQEYTRRIKEVQDEAMQMYADGLGELSPSRFRDMMIKDGCFFLQLALLIVGNEPEKLKYPVGDAFFRKKPKGKQIEVWIESMFFVGNQIPLVVLNALMEQKFFSDVIREIKLEPAPSCLFQKVLCNLLTNSQQQKNDDGDKQQPSDCLQLLQGLILGEGPLKKEPAASINEHDNKQNDLEAANMELVDEKRTEYLDPEEESQSNAAKDYEKNRVCPSATMLYDSFIYIRKLKNGDGVRRIHFDNWYFFAILYLPEFKTGEESEMIFKHLTAYEASQKNNGGEVTSYIRLMKDIVRTAKDVRYLRKKKILQYPNKDDVLYEDELPQWLENLSNPKGRLTYDFCFLKHKIADYHGPPWKRIKSILNLVALLTLLQTVFTVLSYLKPPP